MTILIGAVAGFIASCVPTLFQFLNDYLDHKREREAKTFELEARLHGVELQQDTLSDMQGELEQANLAAQDSGCFNCFRASVRPMVTYGFFALFAFLKVYAVVSQGASVADVWDIDSASLFAGILSFWFGSRTMSNAYAQRKPLASPQEQRGSGLYGDHRRIYEG